MDPNCLQKKKKVKKTKFTSSGNFSFLCLKRIQADLNQKLKQHLIKQNICSFEQQALLYNFHHPGKMLRGTLCCIAAISFNVPMAKAITLGLAIECAHAYTLIHDDLPAMDDDSFRRGQPSHHKKFPQGGSILIGDALQAEAFSLLSHCPHLRDHEKVYALQEFSKAMGAQCLIAGQWNDLYNPPQTLACLKSLHERKTGQLFVAILRSVGFLAFRREHEELLTQLGHHLGFAYQIQDDLYDKANNFLKLGKLRSSDHQNGHCKGILAFLTELEARDLLLQTKKSIACILRQLSAEQTLLEQMIFDKILTV
jgi:geranylgeranyl diphosphate synthase type II